MLPRWLLVIALAFAFSPVVVEWAGHWLATPEIAYVVGFVALLAWRVRVAERTGHGPPPSLAAAAPWLLAAVAIQGLTWVGDVPRVGRVALPLAVVGGLRATTRVPLREAVVAFFLIAPPSALNGDRIELDLAVRLRDALGSVFDSVRPLPVSVWDNGFRVMTLLAGLAWLDGALRERSLGATLRGMTAWVGIGFALQLAGVVAAGALHALAGGAAARLWLMHGIVLCAAALFVATTRRPDAAPRAEPAETVRSHV